MIYRDRPGNSSQPWEPVYDPLKNLHFRKESDDNDFTGNGFQNILSKWDETENTGSFEAYQLRNRFIITHTKSGIVVIDQQNAHERILYEKFVSVFEKEQAVAQQQLIPQKIELSSDDAAIMLEHADDFSKAGFEITGFGNSTVLVNAIPAGVDNSDITAIIEKMIESIKQAPGAKGQQNYLAVARSMAAAMATSRGKRLHNEEIRNLIEQLFACQIPDLTPDGRPVMTVLSFEELNRKFK